MLPHRYSSTMVPQRYYNDKMMGCRPKQPSCYNYNNNMHTVTEIEAQMRAATAIVAKQLNLRPHGESYPDNSIHDIEVPRKLCPKPMWTHKENPVWQPSTVKTNVEFKRLGTELIERRGEDMLIPCYSGLINLYDNIQPKPWQLVSPLYGQPNVVATRSWVTDESSDDSDCSSVSSEESAGIEELKLPELSFELASNWDIDL